MDESTGVSETLIGEGFKSPRHFGFPFFFFFLSLFRFLVVANRNETQEL